MGYSKSTSRCVIGLHGDKTIKRFSASRLASLAPRTRGRRSGAGRALSVEQEQAIARTICDRRPEPLKTNFARWSRAAVMLLIESEYGIQLHVRSLGKYLARWGFTPQKPIKSTVPSTTSG